MLHPEDFIEAEWLDCYRLAPLERWHVSSELWEHYLSIGGSLDPEPDSESPFYDGRSPGPRPVDGRPGLRVIKRGTC